MAAPPPGKKNSDHHHSQVPCVAGYNGPGHPANLPSVPSPRRLPAGDGRGGTAQMEGSQGPGPLQPDFRQCCCPILERKMQDARDKAGKNDQNGPKKETRGRGATTRPNSGQEPTRNRTEPATREKPKTPGKNTEPKPRKHPKTPKYPEIAGVP